MLIGSHVSCSGKKMLVASIEEAIANEATTFMFYTGAPQNTRRKPIEEFNLEEANELLKKYNISKKDIVVHAPYIINLGNTQKESTFELAVNFLSEEIKRVHALGIQNVVLHPGAHVGEGIEKGIARIIEGLNRVELNEEVFICLETMAGKGSECGTTFEQLKQIIDGVVKSHLIKVCLDTCHIHDAGYDLSDFDAILDEFDRIIGLDKLAVIHINDSKNECGAKKDRHENIGFGYIGFDNLNKIVNNPRIAHLPKILETPYLIKENEKEKTISPYKTEIKMFKNQVFLEEEIKNLQK